MTVQEMYEFCREMIVANKGDFPLCFEGRSGKRRDIKGVREVRT